MTDAEEWAALLAWAEAILAPEPPPQGEGPSVTTYALGQTEDMRVRALLEVRRRQGIERYGTELRAHNGRLALADLIQEQVDALLYSAQLAMETGDTTLYQLQLQLLRLAIARATRGAP
jgi:hypothetical protein